MNGDGQGFHGKFQGVVTDNKDPDKTGRIRAKVPDVFGDGESGWALPSAPYGGSRTGFFAVPPTGTAVWIEFQHGDPEYPVWSGCFWARGELPAALLASPSEQVMIVTGGGNNTITLSDVSGKEGITLENGQGAKIAITANGIEIDNGKGASIKLSGTTVSVNGGALEVT